MGGRPVLVALVDYGAGNLASVARGLRAAGGEVRIAASASGLDGAGAIVVPGVGHFGRTATLDAAWRAAIRARLDAGVPLFGICLGMQWLFEGSAEAPGVPGLGVFAGRSAPLPATVKVPHVGWNTLDRTGRPSRLLDGLPADAMAYFTHSFAVPDGPDAAATTTHGTRFASVVERPPVFGVQFHPEKSGADGIRLLRNFLALRAEV